MKTKLDKFIVFALLAFTSIGTAGLVAMVTSGTGLGLLVRQVAAVVFTDGIVLFWDKRRNEFRDSEQRYWANIALWVSVAVVLTFSLIYGVLSVLGASEVMGTKMPSITISGITLFSGTPGELLEIAVVFVLGLQAAGTLAIILYINQISPEVQQALATRQAEEAISKQQLTDYRAAQKAIAPTVGQAQAVAALKKQLGDMNYNDREIESLISVALQAIGSSRGDGLPNVVPPEPVSSILRKYPVETDFIGGRQEKK